MLHRQLCLEGPLLQAANVLKMQAKPDPILNRCKHIWISKLKHRNLQDKIKFLSKVLYSDADNDLVWRKSTCRGSNSIDNTQYWPNGGAYWNTAGGRKNLKKYASREMLKSRYCNTCLESSSIKTCESNQVITGIKYGLHI